MALFSSSTLSLHPKPHIKSSISSKHAVLVTSSYPLPTIFGLHPKPPVQRITACIPAKNTQNSNPSTLTSDFLSAHKKISKVLVENGVKLLVGSLFLVGSLSARPVVAVPVQNGVTMEEQNEKVEDEELFMKLLEREPRNVDALKVVVNGLMRKGRTKEAVKYVERLIDIEPDQVEWRLLQALCYEMMGQLSKAKRLFKEILKRRPLLLRALHGLAMVMHKNHEGDAVFDMLNKALELACREARVTEERNIKILTAQMHLVQGDLDEASKKFQELIDENPRDFRPYLCQGIIFSLQDKKKEADERFEIYRNLVPEEFPQRGFLEDVVLAAKTKTREQLEKQFKAEFAYKR